MGATNFNLVDEPWIDVAGHPRQSLRQFFTGGGEFRNFGGNAVDKMAMLRFMLALAHAAVELPDDAAWRALTPGVLAQKILAYLDTWHDAFDLFGEKPFLQFPQLREKAKNEDKILPYSAFRPGMSNNKALLTNWDYLREIRTEDLPLMLLRGCGFGLGGGRYDNTIVLSPGYKAKLKDKEDKGRRGVPGALVGKNGYLHSYLRGESLLETIKLNMLTLEDVGEMKVFRGMGRPAWEKLPDGEDSPLARQYRDSYQGTLLPLDKFYLLLPEDEKIILTDGIAYPKDPSELVDPALTIRDVNKKKAVVWAKTELRPWRELTAILSFIQAAGKMSSPFFLSCGIRKLPREALVHVWTAGLQVTFQSGEQVISGSDDYVESEFSLLNSQISGYGYDRFVETMKKLDDCAEILRKCIEAYFVEMTEPNENKGKADTGKTPQRKVSGNIKTIADHTVTVFWEIAERDAQLIIDTVFAEDLPDCEAPPELLKKWRRLVEEQYSRACPRETARQLLAWSKCRPFTRMGAKKESKGKTRN